MMIVVCEGLFCWYPMVWLFLPVWENFPVVPIGDLKDFARSDGMIP